MTTIVGKLDRVSGKPATIFTPPEDLIPDEAQIARRLEWATGRNGTKLLDAIRREGLDVVVVTPEAPDV